MGSNIARHSKSRKVVCPSLQVWSNQEQRTYNLMCSTKKPSWLIPLGGNAFDTDPRGPSNDAKENFVSDCGISNWNDGQKKISTYFHSARPGYVLLALRLRVMNSSGSKIRLTLAHAKPPSKLSEETKSSQSAISVDESIQLYETECGLFQTTELSVSGKNWQLAPCGKFYLPLDGYIRVDLEGVSRLGQYFAEITHLLVVPESDFFIEPTELKFVADPADFYFGRRGPSVHLRYILPEGKNFEYFYTELTVPSGQDVIGAYFCAAGFRGGYFGMQRNGPIERRILFSVWSAWDTDNPGDIPDEYKVVLLKKGLDVIDGEFGDEGAGGQSYLVYPWVAGRVYKFLAFATKSGSDDTIYTAWFNPSGELNDWKLIASFRKPKDSTYLTDIYAFSENFIPEQGHLERKCLYGNQWANDTGRTWTELTAAEFTADATANTQNRMDISGGLEIGQFYLRNCGFFSDSVKPNTCFERTPTGIPPQIDFANLP